MRAIARQHGNEINPTPDQPTAHDHDDGPDAPGHIITPGDMMAE